MMDGFDDGPDLLADDHDKQRTDTVDLNADGGLLVDISDSLSERDRVKFTVHTKTTLPAYEKQEYKVVRLHEDFVWLRDHFSNEPDYAAIIIPPSPPRPDFESSREKLNRLSEAEGTMTKEEFSELKKELEAEYLAIFKKTVAMHEVFLQRCAANLKFRDDHVFKVFLTYEKDLEARGMNKKEKVASFFKEVTKTADQTILANQKDEDEFFVNERTFLAQYNNRLKDAIGKADKMTKSMKAVADNYLNISTNMHYLAKIEDMRELGDVLNTSARMFDDARKHEGRMASDADLKLTDTLRYYLHDTSAARDLLYRRAACLNQYEAANKALDKARVKGKDVRPAEEAQDKAYQRFTEISAAAREELKEFNDRRIQYFKKHLTELAELQLKQAKLECQVLNKTLASLEEQTS